jgi:hypothetical protein
MTDESGLMEAAEGIVGDWYPVRRIHCHGSAELVPGVAVQADCGSAAPHGEHDFAEADRICPGSAYAFIADCGNVGPHGEHPLNQ